MDNKVIEQLSLEEKRETEKPPIIIRILPDGTLTTDVEEYLTTWHALFDPLAEKLDMNIHSYGHGEVAFVKDEYYIVIPVWFAEKISALLLDKFHV